MIKKKHIKKFGHTKYYNLLVKFPKGFDDSDYSNWEYLSTCSKEKAKIIYDNKWYTNSDYKPCPMCSGEAGYFVAGYDFIGAKCYSCGVKVTAGDKSKKIWNKRIKDEN